MTNNSSSPSGPSIEEIMAQAVHCKDRLTEKTKGQKLEQLKNQWLQYRRMITGRIEVDEGHTCTVKCHETGQIRKLPPLENVYGCLTSGAFHECHQDQYRCADVYTTRDGEMLCVFSCLFLGGIATTSFYNPSKDGGGARVDDMFHHNNKAKNKFSIPKLERERWTGSTVPLEMPAKASLKRKRGRNERKPSRMRLLSASSPATLSSHFILSLVNQTEEQAAFIQHQQQVLFRKCDKVIERGAEFLRAEVQGIIHDLLWNNHMRYQLRQEREKKCEGKAKKRMRNYVEECINDNPPVRPRVCDFDRVWNAAMKQARPSGEPVHVQHLERDLQRESYYIDTILKMWYFAQSVETDRELKFAVRFRPFAVGLLYALAKGPIVMYEAVEAAEVVKDAEEWLRCSAEERKRLTQKKHIIIEKDEWLAENLPLAKELCYYPVSLRQRTKICSASGSRTSSTSMGGIATAQQEEYSRSDVTKGGNHVKVIMQEYTGQMTPEQIRKMFHS